MKPGGLGCGVLLLLASASLTWGSAPHSGSVAGGGYITHCSWGPTPTSRCSSASLVAAAAGAAQRRSLAPAEVEKCPTGKPATVTRALPALLGPGPLWVTAGSSPVKWESPAAPVQLVWVIDASAPGVVSVSGKHIKSGAALRFTRFGDTIGERRLRYDVNREGYKPSLAKPDDLTKFGFDRAFGWFPEPGCYEIAGRVGRAQPKIYLDVVKSASKAAK